MTDRRRVLETLAAAVFVPGCMDLVGGDNGDEEDEGTDPNGFLDDPNLSFGFEVTDHGVSMTAISRTKSESRSRGGRHT